jgi:predicted Zn-dependent protease with MMP-like domain
MGYIYGLRMDLIGLYDGVGLHRFYIGPVFQALMGYMYGLRMDLIGQFDGVGLHRAFD